MGCRAAIEVHAYPVCRRERKLNARQRSWVGRVPSHPSRAWMGHPCTRDWFPSIGDGLMAARPGPHALLTLWSAPGICRFRVFPLLLSLAQDLLYRPRLPALVCLVHFPHLLFRWVVRFQIRPHVPSLHSTFCDRLVCHAKPAMARPDFEQDFRCSISS